MYRTFGDGRVNRLIVDCSNPSGRSRNRSRRYSFLKGIYSTHKRLLIALCWLDICHGRRHRYKAAWRQTERVQDSVFHPRFRSNTRRKQFARYSYRNIM